MSTPIESPVMARSGHFDRLTFGSPLRNVRTARLVAIFVLILLAIAVAMTFLNVAGMARAHIARTFFVAIPLAVLASLVPISIIVYLDRLERESPWLYLAAVLWGAVIATGLALPLNSGLLFLVARWLRMNPEVAAYFGKEAVLVVGAPIVGPIVEEITKGLGIALLFWLLRDEFDSMRDGLIYGALVGVGFNLFETPLYVASGLKEFGFAPWGIQFGQRFALFGLAGHALFSGLFGAFLGLARQNRRPWAKVIAPIIGLLLAIAAHAFNNALGLIMIWISRSMGQPIDESLPTSDVPFHVMWVAGSIRSLIVFAPFFIILLLVLWRSGRWERNVLRQELVGEGPDIVAPAELSGIEHLKPLGNRVISGVGYWRSKNIVNAQNEIAFRKHRLRAEGRDPEADPLIAGWREEVRRLRG